MHTESTSSIQHALPPGHMLTLALPEGSTLLCLGAPVQLSTTPLSTLDACTGYSMQLHTGQSWRAPARLWVQVFCVAERSSILVQQQETAEKENRLSSWSLRRWISGLWSGKHSLSSAIKREQRAI